MPQNWTDFCFIKKKIMQVKHFLRTHKLVSLSYVIKNGTKYDAARSYIC